MRHFFILMWTGYFASMGIADHVLKILDTAATRMGFCFNDTALMLLNLGTSVLGGMMMAYIFSSHKVFWTKGRAQAHLLEQQLRMMNRHLRKGRS